MRILLLLILNFLTCVSFAQYDTLIVRGVYKGKNLYCTNPFSENNVGFCVVRASVNGIEIDDQCSEGWNEIDIRCQVKNIQPGDPIEIFMIHKKGCKPKVLNAEDFIPIRSYTIKNIIADSTGKFSFITENEVNHPEFKIEQFVWNKWITVAELSEKDSVDTNTYSAHLALHSGVNTLRVCPTEKKSYQNCSEKITITRSEHKPQCPGKVRNYILFDMECRYEIYDALGNIIKRGFAKSIDCKDLKRGLYFLNYDNKDCQFIKL